MQIWVLLHVTHRAKCTNKYVSGMSLFPFDGGTGHQLCIKFHFSACASLWKNITVWKITLFRTSWQHHIYPVSAYFSFNWTDVYTECSQPRVLCFSGCIIHQMDISEIYCASVTADLSNFSLEFEIKLDGTRRCRSAGRAAALCGALKQNFPNLQENTAKKKFDLLANTL